MTGASTISDEIRDLALAAAEAAAAKKATDIRILDIAPLLAITDYFVLLSAGNERQLGTVVEEVVQSLKRHQDRRPLRQEGTKEAGWVVLDYGDIVVHAFTQATRELYDLERLWSDAAVVAFVDPVEARAGL